MSAPYDDYKLDCPPYLIIVLKPGIGIAKPGAVAGTNGRSHGIADLLATIERPVVSIIFVAANVGS